MDGIVEYYYSISECLITLARLNYYSDLSSTNVLYQAIAWLLTRIQKKWAERSFYIRQHREPNLSHLESCLKDRVMVTTDPYLQANFGKKCPNKPKSTLSILASVASEKGLSFLSCV